MLYVIAMYLSHLYIEPAATLPVQTLPVRIVYLLPYNRVSHLSEIPPYGGITRGSMNERSTGLRINAAAMYWLFIAKTIVIFGLTVKLIKCCF